MNTNQALNPGEGTRKLFVLKRLLHNVFVPLEENNLKIDKTKVLLKKFIESIEHTEQQVTGTVDIEVPKDIDDDEESALNNPAEIKFYVKLLVNLSTFVFISTRKIELIVLRNHWLI